MSMEKLKVAMVAAETAPIPDVLGGGAERLVTMLIDQNEIDDRVKFYVVSKYNDKAIKLSKKYKNTEFIYLNNKNLVNKGINLSNKILNGFCKRKLKKYGYYDVTARMLDDDIDIIIDQNGYVRELEFLRKKYGRNRMLAHIHWKVNPSERGVADLYGGVIGVSKFIADYWLLNSTNKEVEKMIVYSAVDEKRFIDKPNILENINLRQEYSLSKDDVVFLYCGRLHEQKGARELIEAFLNINADNIKLIVVGGSYLQNSDMSNYEKELHKLTQMSSKVIFTGYIENDKLGMFYNLADVQVIPTIVEEAAGLVAIEGMYCGLPIIATRSGGLPEYLDEECSVIVEKDELLIPKLTSAMELLYRNKEFREKMSQAAVKRASSYTQARYYNDFIDALEYYNCKIRERDNVREKTVSS